MANSSRNDVGMTGNERVPNGSANTPRGSMGQTSEGSSNYRQDQRGREEYYQRAESQRSEREWGRQNEPGYGSPRYDERGMNMQPRRDFERERSGYTEPSHGSYVEPGWSRGRDMQNYGSNYPGPQGYQGYQGQPGYSNTQPYLGYQGQPGYQGQGQASYPHYQGYAQSQGTAGNYGSYSGGYQTDPNAGYYNRAQGWNQAQSHNAQGGYASDPRGSEASRGLMAYGDFGHPGRDGRRGYGDMGMPEGDLSTSRAAGSHAIRDEERSHEGLRGMLGGTRRWRRASQRARDIMTKNPRAVRATDTVQQIAQIMVDEDCGIVPVVADDNRLVGVVTDRDIVCRLIARGIDLKAAKATEVMTDEVECVTEQDSLHDVLRLMSEHQIRRIPVVARGDRLVGIIALADLAREADVDEQLQQTFEEISSERSFWARLR